MPTQDMPTKALPPHDDGGGDVGANEQPRAGAPPSGESVEEELVQGDVVGRYSVLALLGRGGMGVVYKAYDPQLDRNVALKLLRRGRSSVTADLRLLREAQTLAKLKHPNVVAVYDAGLTHHGVFIAMELLSGKTVNEWLEQHPRAVKEILGVFRAAGRGLLAAHEAGFVHRDFKPSNVLVEDDGSVRVLDFGLASLLDDPSSSGDPARLGAGALVLASAPTAAPSGESRRSSREVFATEAGLVIGTPAFMAPEQIVGSRGDHRSEQFAFAMSLFVSLYDRSPLAGETYEERRDNIVRGLRVTERELERSASGELVPPRVRQAILRALATQPDERFASMLELLAELEEPTRSWRLVAIAGFTLLAGFGVGAMVFDTPAAGAPCSDPEAALEGTWGQDDRAAVEAAFASEQVAGSRPRVLAQLDAYARAWVDMYASSCRATFVTRQQSGPLFDQRMRCLERRRNRLRSTIDALLDAESPQVLMERSIAPFKLPGLEACADLEAMAAERPLPEDGEARERIAALREQLDRADTRYDAGDLAGGLSLAMAAVEQARQLDHPPVLAEALVSLGRMQNAMVATGEAEQTLREAILVASKASDARTEAVAWIELLLSDAWQGEPEAAMARELAALAAVERAGDPVVRGWLLNNLGVVYSVAERSEQSHDYLRQALAAKQATLGPHHVDVGISWHNLGNALVDDDLYDEAQAAFEQARAIFLETVGPTHPMALYAEFGLCRVAQARDEGEAAVALCREALGGLTAARVSPVWLGRAAFTLAQAEWDLGERERARHSAEQARVHAAKADPVMLEEIDRWLADPEGFVPASMQAEPSEEEEGAPPSPAPVAGTG